MPGFIGLANNRDFAKVAGRLCIGRVDEPSSYYAYFHPDYERAQRYCWESGVPTSQLALAWTASWIQQRLSDPTRFDIRWLGAIHAILFLAGWYILLVALRPLSGAAWWIAMAAALWIFTDVGIVSYLNTFYTDAAAIVGVMIMLPAALCLLTKEVPQNGPVLWFGMGALLFLTSKGQHGALAPVLVGFLLASRWQEPASRRTRVLKITVAMALIAGASWVWIETPRLYKAQPRFTLVFSKILLTSPAPSRDVEELGLSQSDLPLIGQHAFLPWSPAFDPVWLDAFSRRTSYGRVALFWLRHPWRTLATLRGDLEKEAWQRRPLEFSNLQPEAGRPPGTRTDQWGSWSALTSRFWRWWPMHATVWYALVLFLGPFLAQRAGPGFLGATAWVAVTAAILGAVEYLIASLADARETDRHLLLFHLFTDFTMFLALIYALGRWSGIRSPSA